MEPPTEFFEGGKTRMDQMGCRKEVRDAVWSSGTPDGVQMLPVRDYRRSRTAPRAGTRRTTHPRNQTNERGEFFVIRPPTKSPRASGNQMHARGSAQN